MPRLEHRQRCTPIDRGGAAVRDAESALLKSLVIGLFNIREAMKRLLTASVIIAAVMLIIWLIGRTKRDEVCRGLRESGAFERVTSSNSVNK